MPGELINIGVVGAAGRMGAEVCKTIAAAPDMELVFAVDRRHTGISIREITSADTPDIKITGQLADAIESAGKIDAIVDFTHPDHACKHGLTALERSVAPIIGTSGLSKGDLNSLSSKAEEKGVPAFHIPNFAVGAVLMMKFAQEAARFLPECEIIELHHEKKVDAPSGTAIRTAELIESARRRKPEVPKTEVVKLEGARGGMLAETPIHSVRLPGLLAHQEVIFGGPGEVLTIKHDSMDRGSFMAGVLLALRNFQGHKGLVVGLENLLE